MSKRTFPEYLAIVESALAKGFTSEAARKNALDYLNCAADIANNELGGVLLRARDTGDMDDESKEWKAAYWNRPALHVWKSKHAVAFEMWPGYVAQMTQAATLRASVKAAPLVAKTPRPKTQKELLKEAQSKTCQICGRAIFAEVGVIAHHGYERPGDGWQTDSCMGARELPLEVSRDVLALYIASLEQGLEVMESGRANKCAEKHPIRVQWEGEQIQRGQEGFHAGRLTYQKHKVEFTRDSFGMVTRETPHALKHFHESYDAKFHANIAGMHRSQFDFWKFAEICDWDQKIRRQTLELNRQRARFAAWPGPTHKWTGETWESLK